MNRNYTKIEPEQEQKLTPKDYGRWDRICAKVIDEPDPEQDIEEDPKEKPDKRDGK